MRRSAYTRMPNELLDALASGRLNGRETRVVLAVLRHSAGFNRDAAELSTYDLAAAAGMDPQQVRLVLQRLTTFHALSLQGQAVGRAPLRVQVTPPATWADAPAIRKPDTAGYGDGYGDGYAPGYQPGYGDGYQPGYAPGYETQRNAGPKPAPGADPGKPKDRKTERHKKQKDMTPPPPEGEGVVLPGHDAIDTPPDLAACKPAFDAWKRIVGVAILPRWRYDDVRNAVEASGLSPEAWAEHVTALATERRAREPRWKVTSPAYFHRAVLNRADDGPQPDSEEDPFAKYAD